MAHMILTGSSPQEKLMSMDTERSKQHLDSNPNSRLQVGSKGYVELGPG